MRLAFADEVGDGGREDQNFQRRHAAFLVDALEQVLGDDALERFGKRIADLVLLLGREDVDDAIDGLCRAGRVQRSEDQWPWLRPSAPVRWFPGRAFHRRE